MTTKTWIGGWGDFNNPVNWTPTGSPTIGDTAYVANGFAMMANRDLSQTQLNLGSTSGIAVLSTYDSVLGNVDVHGTQSPFGPSNPANNPTYYPTHAQINVSGVGGGVVENGQITVGTTDSIGQAIQGTLDFYLGQNSEFVNQGIMVEQSASSITLHGDIGSAFANNGKFYNEGGTADIVDPVIGSGTFNVDQGRYIGSSLTFEQSVSSGQTIEVSARGSLTLNDPGQFFGGIYLQPGGSIDLKGIQPTSYDFTGSALFLNQNNHILAAYRFADPSTSGFSIAHSGNDTIITGVNGVTPHDGLIG